MNSLNEPPGADLGGDPRKTRRRMRRAPWLEIGSTVVAVALSLLSLWVAIGTWDSNKQMVEANYRMVTAASWPQLQVQSGNFDGTHQVINLSLENAGVGPAKLESFEMFWRGKPYRNSFTLLVDCCGADRSDPRGLDLHTQSMAGSVLRAGDSRTFLALEKSAPHEAVWAAFDRVRLQELKFQACYCSVFDECWISPLHGFETRRVKTCPTPKTPYIQ